MKKFVTKTLIFAGIILAMFLLILSQADGYTDAFYIRFTTPKQQNLILGSSRAAQGIHPGIIKKSMDIDMYNFSFTITQSPYGETYLNSVKEKLLPQGENGLFILTVEPLSISSITMNPNYEGGFRELDLCLGNTTIVNMNPNFQYLLNNLSGKYYEIPLRTFFRKMNSSFLHENGWLEVTVNMDSALVKQRTDHMINNYKKTMTKYRYSSTRLNYLKKTIAFLRKYGAVYLVRLPMQKEMMEMEKELIPDFNEKMDELSHLTNGYFDMTPLNSTFDYTDGNHLYKESGEVVTMEIIDWIQNQ